MRNLFPKLGLTDRKGSLGWLCLRAISLAAALALGGLLPLSTGARYPASAAFPGDNGLIAFSSDRDGNGEIYVMRSDGSGQTNLTNHAAGDADPAWSADGLRLAFTSGRDGNAEIYVMNADGSDPTRLTTDPSTDGFPGWSPDGSQIVFSRFSSAEHQWDIWRMNSDGTGLVRLTDNPAEDIMPVWSPDGTKIAFQSNRDLNGEIYVMNPDGSDQTNLTNSSDGDGQPDWSPDGSRLVLATSNGISVMNADGSGFVRLTDRDTQPAWSPDGRRIVFMSSRDFNDEIYVMNADGTGATRLTNNAPPGNTLPQDWFPDWQPTSIVAMTYLVNTNDDADDGTCDGSHCSLREAIHSANSNPAVDTIVFSIPGAPPFTIQPGSPLPDITDPVTIDGTTQAGFAGAPVIELDGTNAGEGVNGLVLAAGQTTVRGFVVNRFSASGILLSGGSGNTIEGNYLGTDRSGAIALGNTRGITLTDSSNNLVERNTISGNRGRGVFIAGNGSSGNVVRGNFIGTDRRGLAPLGNSVGVRLSDTAWDNRVGGTDSGAGNVISGNVNGGIAIGEGTAGNLVQGNLIGTDVTGMAPLGNGATGVLLANGAAENVIGGTEAGARNVISANGAAGIVLDGAGTSQNVVQGNFIGTSADGTGALANTPSGIWIVNGASNNMIGGTDPAAGNLISGNDNGVVILGEDGGPPPTGNVLEGNFIGTDLTGMAPLPNADRGVVMSGGASENRVGGTGEGAGNLISGNASDGISIGGSGTNRNLVEGNLIGTDASGLAALANAGSGVLLAGGASDNLIGGTDPAARNIISGNSANGVAIFNPGTTRNVVQGNYIGTDIAGTIPLGNLARGIDIGDQASDNLIGGTEVAAGNLISGNGADGVAISEPGTTGNTVQGNYIGTDVTGTSTTGAGEPGVVDFTVTALGETCPTYPPDTDFDGFVSQSDDPLAPWSATSVHFRGTDECSGQEMLGEASLVYRYRLEFPEVASLTSIAVSGAAFNGPDNVLRVLDENMNVLGSVGTVGGNSFVTNFVMLDGIEGTVFFVDEFDTSSTWRFRQSIVVNGPLPMANRGSGVGIFGGATGNLIGGVAVGARNLISGNSGDGVGISGPGTTGNLVQGNYIGTDVHGTADIGNSGSGIVIGDQATDNLIGGPEAGAGNVISGNGGEGIGISGVGTNGNVIQANFIGTDVSGMNALGNSLRGVFIVEGPAANVIGGTEIGAANLISGNGLSGVNITDGDDNIVQGNYIGTDQSGAAPIGNGGLGGGNGVVIDGGSVGNLIGGTGSAARNVISGNSRDGVEISGPGTTGNLVQGNYIGTDITGTSTTGAAGPGIVDFTVTALEETCPTHPPGTDIDGFVSQSDDSLAPWSATSVHFRGTDECIGQEMLGEASLIYRYRLEFPEATSLTSIAVSGAAFNGPDNVLRVLDENMNVLGSVDTVGGNSFATTFVMLDGVEGTVFFVDEFDTSSTWRFRESIVVNGPLPMGNRGSGVGIFGGASGNSVGGTSEGARNIISGNGGGVGIFDTGTTGNVVQGNYIGVDYTGTAALANSGIGVNIGGGASDNLIGGPQEAARNIISGNMDQGVGIFDAGTSGNVIQGNYVGTDVSGTVALGNSFSGVWIAGGATDNLIGGTEPGAGNVLSGNGFEGVTMIDPGTSGNLVQGNLIGTDVTGALAVPNLGSGGVGLFNAAALNTIGGTEPGAGNTIALNYGPGIAVNFEAGSGNAFLSNRLFSNGGLGIDLNEDGVTLNDARDRDTGPNDLQNFPVLSPPVVFEGSIKVAGELASQPNSTYRIEFFSVAACDDSRFGEGDAFLGFVDVTTGPSGLAAFVFQLPPDFPLDYFVTATATDAAGSTSEFSRCAGPAIRIGGGR